MEFRKKVATILHAGKQRRQRRTAKEGEGGMICENGSETYTLPHVKQMTSASSMHEAGHPKPVLRDNPEGQGREGGGRGVQEGRTHV